MGAWDELLRRLAETPRENGTPQLRETATFLLERMQAAGWEAHLVAFEAHPYALRLAGVLILVGCLAYFRWMRGGRTRAALALALAMPFAVVADLDHLTTLFSGVGASTQHHVEARLAAREPRQRLIFAAHYDTKTDLFDHVQRAPVDLLGLPLAILLVLGALVGAAPHGPTARWLRRAALVAAPVYGVAAFGVLSAGAFVPSRSPGALDDGAACALLVRLAEQLAAQPRPAHTEVEILLLSAEEVGVQGSWEYARRRFAHPPDLPTRVVNLEALGASRELAVIGRERFLTRSFAPDPALFALLDAAHREQRGQPLALLRHGAATDARSFLAQRVPAATLISLTPTRRPLRGLHSARDARSRLDEAALQDTLGVLLAVVAAAEARAP